MRRFAVSLAIISTCLVALGQGKVLFGNDSARLFVLDTPMVEDPWGPIPASPLPSGRTLTAVLYAGTSAGSLSRQTNVVLGGAGWLTYGRMANRPVILTSVPGGAAAYFQIFITDTGTVLPGTIVGGGPNYFTGATYFGTSGLFTAIPGSSISYPSLATGASASTWSPGPLQIGACLSCTPPFFEVQPLNTWVVAGNTTSFWAHARSYQGLQVAYQWWKNGSPIAGATDSGLTLVKTTLSDAGVYYVVASDIYGGRQSQTAALTVLAPIIAATLSSPAYTANNQFQFTVTGTTGTNYIVQVSTNLATADWVSVFTNASPFTFVDTNANSFPRRFYRAYAP